MSDVPSFEFEDITKDLPTAIDSSSSLGDDWEVVPREHDPLAVSCLPALTEDPIVESASELPQEDEHEDASQPPPCYTTTPRGDHAKSCAPKYCAQLFTLVSVSMALYSNMTTLESGKPSQSSKTAASFVQWPELAPSQETISVNISRPGRWPQTVEAPRESLTLDVVPSVDLNALAASMHKANRTPREVRDKVEIYNARSGSSCMGVGSGELSPVTFPTGPASLWAPAHRRHVHVGNP